VPGQAGPLADIQADGPVGNSSHEIKRRKP